jgi:uncharacterized YccA/Bax inhibitor family protein
MPNPTLREDVFNNLDNRPDSLGVEKSMTETGTLFKTLVLGSLMTLSAMYTWYLVYAGFADKANLLTSVGAIGGFITVLIVCFAPKNRFLALTTSIYALFEGLFLGAISAMFNAAYPGIVTQAMLGTMLTIFGMYIAYSTKLVRMTDTFRKTIFIATFAVAGIYILQWILMLFHASIPQIFSNSPIGIAFSVIVCAIAAFNLIVDFDFIERFKGQAPDYMEWYGAFSLMVTIVWLYVEILKLLAKLNSRR